MLKLQFFFFIITFCRIFYNGTTENKLKHLSLMLNSFYSKLKVCYNYFLLVMLYIIYIFFSLYEFIRWIKSFILFFSTAIHYYPKIKRTAFYCFSICFIGSTEYKLRLFLFFYSYLQYQYEIFKRFFFAYRTQFYYCFSTKRLLTCKSIWTFCSNFFKSSTQNNMYYPIYLFIKTFTNFKLTFSNKYSFKNKRIFILFKSYISLYIGFYLTEIFIVMPIKSYYLLLFLEHFLINFFNKIYFNADNTYFKNLILFMSFNYFTFLLFFKKNIKSFICFILIYSKVMYSRNKLFLFKTLKFITILHLRLLGVLIFIIYSIESLFFYFDRTYLYLREKHLRAYDVLSFKNFIRLKKLFIRTFLFIISLYKIYEYIKMVIPLYYIFKTFYIYNKSNFNNFIINTFDKKIIIIFTLNLDLLRHYHYTQLVSMPMLRILILCKKFLKVFLTHIDIFIDILYVINKFLAKKILKKIAPYVVKYSIPFSIFIINIFFLSFLIYMFLEEKKPSFIIKLKFYIDLLIKYFFLTYIYYLRLKNYVPILYCKGANVFYLLVDKLNKSFIALHNYKKKQGPFFIIIKNKFIYTSQKFIIVVLKVIHFIKHLILNSYIDFNKEYKVLDIVYLIKYSLTHYKNEFNFCKKIIIRLFYFFQYLVVLFLDILKVVCPVLIKLAIVIIIYIPIIIKNLFFIIKEFYFLFKKITIFCYKILKFFSFVYLLMHEDLKILLLLLFKLFFSFCEYLYVLLPYIYSKCKLATSIYIEYIFSAWTANIFLYKYFKIKVLPVIDLLLFYISKYIIIKTQMITDIIPFIRIILLNNIKYITFFCKQLKLKLSIIFFKDIIESCFKFCKSISFEYNYLSKKLIAYPIGYFFLFTYQIQVFLL